ASGQRLASSGESGVSHSKVIWLRPRKLRTSWQALSNRWPTTRAIVNVAAASMSAAQEPATETLGDQTGNLSVRFSLSQDEELKWSATPLPACPHASREVESHWELLCQPCMAYWVCHCLLQRLFLCAGPRQVLTVLWRLSQFQSPVSPLLLRVPSFQLPPEPFRTQAPPAKV